MAIWERSDWAAERVAVICDCRSPALEAVSLVAISATATASTTSTRSVVTGFGWDLIIEYGQADAADEQPHRGA